MQCSIQSCERTYRLRKGLCTAHYQRQYLNLKTKDTISKRSKRGEALLFIEKITKNPPNCCVKWKYAKDSKGYGSVYVSGKRYKAHRYSLILYSNRIPSSDVFACHICDIKDCINPLHVYWGDAKSNALDRHLETSTVSD